MKKKLYLDKELLTGDLNVPTLDGGTFLSWGATQCFWSACPQCATNTLCPSKCPNQCPDETE